MACFPYFKDWRTGLAIRLVDYFFGGDRAVLDRTLYPSKRWGRGGTVYAPTHTSLPGGLSSVPFRWDYHDRTFPMEFPGGFVGVAQDAETLALRPEVG